MGSAEAESGELAKVEDFLRAKLTPAFAERSAVAEALANGYLKALRLFDALNILEGWVAREPQNPAAYSLRARVWNQVRTFGRAAEDFETALRLDPDRDADRLGLGMALIEVSRYEDAIPHLERLRATDPSNPDIAVYAAFALDRVGREDEAVRILNDVLARDPDHIAALIGHARVDLETGREADAERYARRVLASTPNHRTAYHILHQALVSLGRVEDARVAKARLVELDDLLVRYYDLANRKIPQKPNDPNLICQLGDVLVALGQTRQAEGWYLNAVRIAPKYAPAHRSLAAYYAKAGDEEKAAEHRQLAESAPP